MSAGGSVEVAGGVTSNSAEAISVAGAGSINFGALRAGAGGGTWAGQVTLADTAVRLGALAGQALTVTGAIINGAGTGFNISGESGTGVVILNPAVANTYTGTTGIIRGILRLGKTDALPVGTTLDVDSVNSVTDVAIFDLAGFNQTVAVLQDTATLNINGKITNSQAASTSILKVNQASNTTFDGVIENGAGSVVLTKAGTGSLTLAGVSTATGGTNIENGKIIIGGGNDRLATAGSVVLGAAGTAGVLVIGDGTARTQALAGLTTTGNGGAVVGGAAANSTLTLNIAGSQTFGGTLGGAGANENNLVLTKTGAGSLTLPNANTHTGGTNIQNGTLTAGATAALGAAGQIVTLGTASTTGVVDFATDTSANAYVINVGSGNTGTVLVDRATPGAAITHALGLPTIGNSMLNAQAGANVTSGTPVLQFTGLTLSAGAAGLGTATLNPTTAQIAVNGPVTRPGAQANSLTLGGTMAGNTITGVISGALTLTKSGTSTWILSNANTHTGITKVNGGSLILTNNLALQGSPFDPSGAGLLDLSATNTPTFGGLTGAGNYTPPANVTGLTLNNGTGAVVTYSGSLGEGTPGLTLTKTGANTQALSGVNSYTGLTTVSGGSLQINSAGAIGGSAILVTGGAGNPGLTLDGGVVAGAGKTLTINGGGLGGFFGALSNNSGGNEWAGGVIIGSAGTRIGVNGTGTLTVSGVISSGASPHGITFRLKDNTGGLVLSGANTYLGDTTLVTATGVVQLAGGANRLPVGTRLLFGSAAVSGILDLNGQDQEIAGLSVVSGTTNEIKASLPGTLTVNTAAASPSTYSGLISGAAALAKKGPDTLTLTGANTYTGTTTVEEGILLINGSTASTGLINVSALATLGGSGSGGNVTVADNGTLSPGSATVHQFAMNDLTLGNGSFLAFELDAPDVNINVQNDYLNVAGNLVLDGVLLVTPRTLPGFGTPVAGDKWLLMTAGGTITDNALAVDPSSPALSPGLDYAVETDTSVPGFSKVYLSVVAVPEAGTAGLLAAGLMLLARRLRRGA
ncbi:MAG: autotransporter-associated beta strand repeat-containing protein [Kiritimatiellia bacterium]